MSHPIFLPGATIGILGGGQLGRMLSLAASQLGYRTAVLEPGKGGPASQICDFHIDAAYDDPNGLDQLCDKADVATVEFENIPAESLEHVADRIPLHPGVLPITISQNRAREKSWLRQNGFPTPEYAIADSPESLATAAGEVGFPCVAKTADFGYDGKGQQKIGSPDADFEAIWRDLDAPRSVVEAWVPFEAELSVVCARSASGETAIYDPGLNVHTHHILDTTTVPSGLPPHVLTEARKIATGILDAFEYIGVLAVELFLTPEGTLLVNELAPRTHNSGHHTIDACVTSQFEQQVRAICGLPLGSPALHGPATMTNLLGDLWLDAPDQTPDWPSILFNGGAGTSTHLHLYGKSDPRLRRKMGHITTLSSL